MIKEITVVSAGTHDKRPIKMSLEVSPSIDYAGDATKIFDFLQYTLPNGTYQELCELIRKDKGY